MNAATISGRPVERYSTEQVSALEQDLRASIKGSIRFDSTSRVLYSTDASMYQIMPVGVVEPENVDDVEAVVKACLRHGVSITPRGGGTGLGGQTVGPGVQIDFSRKMNRILEIDPQRRIARVEPGVVLDELNRELKKHGLTFAPDVATSSRATIGGMVAINSCGARSVIYGRTADHLESIDVVLSDGSRAVFGEETTDDARRKADGTTVEAAAYRETAAVVHELRDEIRARYPRVPRSSGGYALNRLLDEKAGLKYVVAGSEGTLALVTGATLRLVPVAERSVLLVVHFDDLLAALRATHEILAVKPSAVEVIDNNILRHVAEVPALRRKGAFIRGEPRAIVMIEFQGSKDDDLTLNLDRAEAFLRERGYGRDYVRRTDPSDIADVWEVRKLGLGLMIAKKREPRPIAFIEDACVPTQHLADYISALFEKLGAMGVDVGCYAHASVGLLHVRPFVDLHTPEGIARMSEIARISFDLVRSFGGAVTGEHGDGIVRSTFLEPLYGPRITDGFRRIKKAFDPAGIFNPGKIVDPYPPTENLRYSAPYHPPEIATAFNFKPWGGLLGSVEMCTGVGHCRKKAVGIMCPSYMATLDEADSTRGRANALRNALAGKIDGVDDWVDSPEVSESMEYCLACKGCRAECPTGVDVARFKAEWLYQRGKKHGFTLRQNAMGHAAAMARLGCAFAPVSNWALRSYPGRKLAEWLLGVDARHRLPAYTTQTFPAWFRRRRPSQKIKALRGKVVLWDDTWMDFHEPGVGISAVEVLEACGYEVVLPNKVCCGRPFISKGLLDEAAQNARHNVPALDVFAREGIPILFAEPSCYACFVDEYLDFVPGEAARRVAERCQLIEEFLADAAAREEIPWNPSATGRVLFHAHCHEKATVGTAPARRLLAAMPGPASEIDSGCCGMAGSFGYEKAHYEVSRLIGEERLFPAVRSAPTDAVIAVSGFSCRHQIAHHTGRAPSHIVEVVRRRIRTGHDGPNTMSNSNAGTT